MARACAWPTCSPDGPMTVEDLATAARARPDTLRRLAWGLAGLGLVTLDGENWVSLTEMGALLRSGTSGSLRDLALYRGGESYMAWGQLEHAVRTGECRLRRRLRRGLSSPTCATTPRPAPPSTSTTGALARRHRRGRGHLRLRVGASGCSTSAAASGTSSPPCSSPTPSCTARSSTCRCWSRRPTSTCAAAAWPSAASPSAAALRLGARGLRPAHPQVDPARLERPVVPDAARALPRRAARRRPPARRRARAPGGRPRPWPRPAAPGRGHGPDHARELRRRARALAGRVPGAARRHRLRARARDRAALALQHPRMPAASGGPKEPDRARCRIRRRCASSASAPATRSRSGASKTTGCVCSPPRRWSTGWPARAGWRPASSTVWRTSSSSPPFLSRPRCATSSPSRSTSRPA